MLKKTLLLGLFCLLLTSVYSACRDDGSALETLLPAPDERLPLVLDVEATTATVYYATTDLKYLLPLNISINATKEVAAVAMEKLLAGPPNSNAAPVLPGDAKLLDLYSSNNIVYVNLTAEIADLSAELAPLAVDAILCTILPLAEGYRLQILIEGRVWETLGGVEIGAPLSLPYINMVDEAAAGLMSGNDNPGLYLTYYLSDAQSMYLVPQTIFFPLDERADPDEPRALQYARVVLEQLLAEPDDARDLYSPFAPDLEILGLELADGVLFVDFSDAFLHTGGGAALENMMISCLTYSLTGLPGISAVQILVAGSNAATLPEGLEISRPLTPNQPINNIL